MFSHVAVARIFRRSAAIAMLLAGLSGAGEAAAQQQQQQQQQQGLTISAGLELSPTYQPDAWQPVHIQLRNASSRSVDGSVVLPLAHEQAPAIMTLPVSVPPHSLVTATIWAYFPPPPKLTAQQQQQQQQRRRVAERPPLSIAEWRGTDGSLLSRAQVAGIPFVPPPEQDGQHGEVILLVNDRPGTGNEAYDTQLLLDHLNDSGGVPLQLVSTDRSALSRQGSGLRPLKAIVLDGVDPQALDLAQRSALEEYLRGGGIVIIAAPIDVTARAGTWLAPLLPVRLIGTRVTNQVHVSPDGRTLKLRQPVPIIEAVRAADADVLLHDRDYVHVAVRPVGLGKVVFTSFPINALDPSQPQTAALWGQLLSLREPRRDWGSSQLADVRHDIVSGMVGRSVAPWAVAAGVAAGYLLVIVAAQGVFFGPSRPRAFAVSVGAAVLLSGALVAMGMARRGERNLQSARLAVMDVAPDGGGWQTETVAFVGADDPNMQLEAANGGGGAMVRPALADARNRPTLRQQPFAAEKAEVFPDRIERVWEAAGPADPAWRVAAVGQFGPTGLTLDVENGLGMTLESPLVIWNGRAVVMADLPAGRTLVRELQFNARQQFTGLGVITSDQAKRRAQVVAASLAPAYEASVGNVTDAPPMLIGWVNDSSRTLIRPSGKDAVQPKSLVMVRTPLRVQVAPTGSAVSIPAALVQVDTGRLPYDREKGASVPTPQPGSWRISFTPPPQAGRIKPERVTISARVTLPSHTLRMQLASRPSAAGTGGGDGGGEWSRKVGTVDLTLNCGSSDYDENGRVAVTLDVQPQEATTSVPWQISDLTATIDGVVIGPPPPIVLDAPRRAGTDADADDAEDGPTDKAGKL